MSRLAVICALGTIASVVASASNFSRSTGLASQPEHESHRYGFLSGTRFDYTGSVQQYVTPAGSSGMIKFTLYGASGGDPLQNYGFYGGRGAIMQGILNLADGTTLQIYVGGQGTSTTGGFNGGGAAIGNSGHSFAGGGATDIRTPPYSLDNRVMVAGGGGGSSGNCGTHGGAGGYPDGSAAPTCSTYFSGGGGTSNAGGGWADENPPQGYCSDGANRGTFGQGGMSCARDQNGLPYSYGGGGGGGWFGGGGAFGAGGGGGSSYSIVTPTYVSSEGVLSGHGYLVIELLAPTAAPTISPSLGPPSAGPTSSSPTKNPTLSPTVPPTQSPTQHPSHAPSIAPSAQPTAPPTSQPSASPSSQPSGQPSSQPSTQPSAHPTAQPSGHPSSAPSAQPSVYPSSVPTAQPSCLPSSQPSSLPSAVPSAVPSVQPTVQPSGQPSSVPSVQPSAQPSVRPSTQPSVQPTTQPSVHPSGLPSAQPTVQPSMQPSTHPSNAPSALPSSQPTTLPSSQPSALPSAQPSVQPTTHPSGLRSAQPTVQPTSVPSTQPSEFPSSQPTVQPSGAPTSQPTFISTSQPSVQPSTEPTSLPSGSPSMQPTSTSTKQPSAVPSASPSTQPSSHPSKAGTPAPSPLPALMPSTGPTIRPSLQPSAEPTMGPTRAGVQVYFNGTQTLRGLNSTEFINNPVVVASWRAAVSKACALDKSSLVRVDIISLEDMATRRLTTHESRHLREISEFTLAVIVGFKVSYTLEDFESTNPDVTTQALKDNYALSVAKDMFTPILANEIAQRTTESESDALIAKILPAEVAFGKSYVILYTTYSPTAAPTYSPVAPVIGTITSMYTSTTIDLDLTFQQSVIYPGVVYCAVFARNTTSVTVGQIVTAANSDAVDNSASNSNSGNMAPYLSGDNAVHMTIANLLALTHYVTYCYVESAQGVGNTQSEVLNTRREHSTECCKTIHFTSAPTVLYGDVNKYDSAQSKQFVFSYTLSAAPSSTLVVTPVFNTTTGMSKVGIISTLPAYALFTPTTRLTGSFIITINESLFTTDDYLLTLTTTDYSGTEYIPTTHQVRILASNEPPPPPRLLSATFSRNGGAINVLFDSPTSQPTKTVPCDTLFVFPGAQVAKCAWISNSAITITFPAYNDSISFAEPGDVIFIQANTFTAACGENTNCAAYALNSAQNVTFAAPAQPTSPNVVILLPSKVASCENVTIDASSSSGHGGRPWKYVHWTVRTNTMFTLTNTTLLEEMLNRAGRSLTQSVYLPAAEYFSVGVEYTITMYATNFLGKSSSASVLFTLSTNPNMPTVQILGPSVLTYTPADTITLYSSSLKSSCAERDVKFTSHWRIYDSNNTIVDVPNTSKDGAVLIVTAGFLNVGSRYRLEVTTTAEATSTNAAVDGSAVVYVNIVSGKVVAVVHGGERRLVWPENTLFLDASGSYDENTGSNRNSTHLQFAWSCLYLTNTRYGASCDDILVSNTTTSSVVSIIGAALTLADTYSVQVYVTAADGRSGTKATVLQVQNSASSTSASITYFPTKINANNQLIIAGLVSAQYNLTASWSASINGTSFPLVTQTPQVVMFDYNEVHQGIPYSLLVPGGTLSAGSSVTFRLFVDRTLSGGNSITSGSTDIYVGYSEITIDINAPPTSGTFVTTPSSGSALTTLFRLAATGWTDHYSDLPLMYAFFCVTAPDTDKLTLQARQGASAAYTVLPASRNSDVDTIFVLATIYDIMLAYSEVNRSAAVYPVTSDALDLYIQDSINTFDTTLNTNQAGMLMNNVLSTISPVSCQGANSSYCASLNRLPCSNTPHTCSSCLDGYTGVSGPANTQCVPVSANSRPVGANCTSNSDCFLASCVSNICTAPMKQCPSAMSNAECSGNGICAYNDNTGKVLSSCTVLQSACTANCVCGDGYGGSDCSFTTAEVQSVAAVREQMSDVFLRVHTLSNPSFAYLASAANTLNLLADTSMSVNNNTVVLYFQAINSVAQMATEGYLVDAPYSTVHTLLDLVGRSAKLYNTNTTSITTSLNYLTEGVLASMVKGQLDTSVATENIKFTASKNRTSVLSAFTSPTTTAEDVYGVQGSCTVEITDRSSIASCDSGEGYVEMSLTQWGRNPYSDNFHGTSDTDIAAPQIRMQSSVPAGSVVRRTSSDMTASDTVAYYVTLQFHQAHKFSKISDTNTTFPECTVYNEQTRVYQSCNGCNVSSYTNTYVTFACYDISKLCNSNNDAISSKIHTSSLYSDDLDHSSNSHRKLTDDDYLESALGLGAQSSITSIQYTALLTTFTSILSQNPANINFAAAKVIISIVVSLFGIIAVGFAFFHRWDVYDHDIFLYKHKEPPHLRKKKRKELKLQAEKSSFFGSLYGSVYGSFYGSFHNNESHSNVGTEKVTEKPSLARRALEENSEKTMPPTPEARMQKKSYFGSFFGPVLTAAGNETVISTFTPKPQDVVSGVTNTNVLRKDPTRESFYTADVVSKNNKSGVQNVSFYPSVFDIYGTSDIVKGKNNSAYDKSDYGSFYGAQDSVFSTVIDDYLEMVIPVDNIDGSHTSVYTKAMNIIAAHPLSMLFFEPSLQVNRVQRWTMMWLGVMCGMFVDTLFFSSFFPVADECANYIIEEDCLAPQNEGLNMALCVWRAEDNTCAPAEPPSDMMFVMILVMVTLVICVPISFVFDYIMSEVCAKRPDFSQWGYNNDAILGTSTQKLGEFNTAKILSPIVALRLEIESARAALGASSRFHTNAFKQSAHKSTVERALDDIDAEARGVYDEYIGVDEEVTHILQEAIQYLTGTLGNHDIPWHNTFSSTPGQSFSTAMDADRMSKVHAIEEYLGVYADGTPVPLTALQYLQYGTARNMLVARIELAREQQQEIRDTIEGLGDNELLSKDQALTQFFILEQFSSFKQYALRSQLFSFAVTTALTVDPGQWLCGWVFLIACLVFFLYWTLMWGITTTNATIEAWGINFAIAAAQDLILIQTFRLFVLYMIANFCIKPQLTAIYRTLQRLAIEYVQDELPDAFGVIKVVQHVSPACRVASMKVSDNLAAGQILRHIDDRDIRNFRTASDIKLPLLFLSVVAIPVLIGVLSEASGDIALDTVLPSAFSMFILAHYMAWAISPMLVILPYIALLVWLRFRRPLYRTAERRLHARDVRRKEAKLETESWRTRRGTPLDTFGSATGAMQMYAAAQCRQWSACCLDTLAAVAVCIGNSGGVLSRIHSTSTQRDESLLQWQKLNIPQPLQGKITRPAATPKGKYTNPSSVAAVPERIQRLTKDASVRWDIEEGPSEEDSDSPAPDYLLSLLGLGDMYLLQPSVLSAEESSAQFGSILYVGTNSASATYKKRCAAARFRNEHTFPTSSKSAIVRVISSYKEQMQDGKLYYLSLYDEQLLMSAENDKQLLRYAGHVHVRDLACMLEEILYFYRPEGQMLGEKEMKTVFCAYDDWVQANAKPLSHDVLASIHQLLAIQGQHTSQRGSTVMSTGVDLISEAGFYQQHKLVVAMRIKSIIAEEISVTRTNTYADKNNNNNSAKNNNKIGRESVRWSDIRRILDNTQTTDSAQNHRQTSLRLAQNSSLSQGSGKYQVLQSVAARAARKKRRTEKMIVSPSAAPFDLFARWLYYVLKDLQVEKEREERKALRLEMAVVQEQLEESMVTLILSVFSMTTTSQTMSDSRN